MNGNYTASYRVAENKAGILGNFWFARQPKARIVFMDEKNDARSLFIKNIGLGHDPFQTPVAELELGRVKEKFYSYYLPTNSNKKELIQQLRAPQDAFLFGMPGSGKSSTRLTLDADCRTTLDQTLAITYTLGEDVKNILSSDEHGERLAEFLIIDLTLSAIERFNPITPPTKRQVESLKKLIPYGGRRLPRLIEIILEKIEDKKEPIDEVWGISKDWEHIGKAPVKYVGASSELAAFLNELVPPNREEKTANWTIFYRGIKTARQWGFRQFFILIDGVDANERQRKEMMALISPLLDQIKELEKENIYFKFFLPAELKKDVRRYLRQIDKNLLLHSFSSIIEWNDIGLRQLLAQRFRAAASRSGPNYVGLDSLSSPNLNLDEKLIRAAEGSPRRLLEMVSELIDAHVASGSNSTQFTPQDWESYRQKSSL